MVWFGATSVINQPSGVEYIWMGQWSTISYGSKLFSNKIRARIKNDELKKNNRSNFEQFFCGISESIN